MDSLLNIIMKDPEIKKEIISQTKKVIKNITFTEKDMEKLKIVMIDTIAEACNTVEIEDAYYEIQEVVLEEIKKAIINKTSK